MDLLERFPVDRIRDISYEAGRRILEISQNQEKWSVQYKGEDDPVTAADRSAHDYIVQELPKVSGFEEVPILSEEGYIPKYEERVDWDYFWCVDPLDGTKEFIKQTGDYTVNIGLCKRGEPIAGFIHVPVTGETVWAIRGHGAFYQSRKDSPVQSISCAEFSWELPHRIIAVQSRNHGREQTEALTKRLRAGKIIYAGSSVKFIKIATGAAHIYPRMAPTSEWDTCAAHIIINEAGGRIMQLNEDGDILCQTLLYNKPNLLNPFFIVLGKLKEKNEVNQC